MQETKSFVTRSLVITLVLNGVLLVVLYLLGGGAISPLALFGTGAAVTLVLWFAVRTVGARAIEQAARAAVPAAAPKEVPAAATQPPTHAYETSAVQLLSLLQRKGRLIDFLQEDLAAYDDAQIGAAVRTIHEGCKQALAAHVTLAPIYAEAEGATITVAPGFDAHAVRLTGNIVGDPPFKGALRHRGWRVQGVNLPERTADAGADIVAPAEIELS